MNIGFIISIVTLAATLISGLLAATVTAQAGAHLPSNAPALVAFSTSMIVLYAGCSALFLLGLKNFTAQLKLAFAILCAGYMGMALSESQLPVATVLGFQDSAWMQRGFLLIPILAAICTIYIGTKRLSKLFGVQSIWQRGWFVAVVSVALSVVGFLQPVAVLNQGLVAADEQAAKGTVALMALCMGVFIGCLMLTGKIYRHVSADYSQAMRWLFISNIGWVVTTVETIEATVLLGNRHWVLLDGYTILFQIILTAPLVKAGYEFYKLETVTSLKRWQDQEVSVVDIVVAAAEKVSNTAAIETALDDMRRITARLPAGKMQLSSEDEAKLWALYKRVEAYLTMQDPVRRYSKEDLRQRISQELHVPQAVFADI